MLSIKKRNFVKNRKIYDRNNDVKYTAKEINMAIHMKKELEDVLDIMFYLMQNSRENTFVTILISAKNIALKEVLEKEKRDTDLVYDIDKDESICAMICQETEVDGGYHFAQRIIENITAVEGKEIYCSVLEVKTNKYSAKDIIFRTLNTYLKARHEEKSGQIIFKSLY